MSVLLSNIQTVHQYREQSPPQLRGAQMSSVPTLDNAWIYIADGQIQGIGSMDEPYSHQPERVVDCSGQHVLPGFVDSHTHLVFAETREGEFLDRLNGLTYEEIAARGGGILNSAEKLQTLSEEELYKRAVPRLKRALAQGTTAMEMKSGYGLTAAAELKMLRVIKRLKQHFPMLIKSTFLGAHAIPKEYKQNRKGYMDLLIDEMLPQVAEEDLADYIDVFCETNYFTVAEMERILEAGKNHGLKPKVHVNQFTSIGAIQSSIAHNAVSVDHLEVMKEADVEALAQAKTIATLLPSCSFFLGLDYAPAQKLIDSGAAIALASDFNPGSTPSHNLNFVMALACIKMRMTPAQALNALTVNAAHAIESAHRVGCVRVGARADLMFSGRMNGLESMPYHFGESLIDRVMLNGEFLDETEWSI